MNRPPPLILALLLAGLILPGTAPAQSQPAPSQPGQGVLRPPSRTAPAREAPHPPPKAAPVAPVQQVRPFSSPVTHPAPSTLGHSAPGKPAPQRRATHHAKPHHRPVHRPPVVPSPQPPAARKAVAPAAAAAASAAALVVAPKPTEPAPPPPPPVDHRKGTVTGLPLPRWVALRSAEVNMRAGPGTRFPVEWQYHRRDLPVKLEREFGVWRLLEDQDGVKGWVHEANLTSRRGFVLIGPQQILRSEPSDSAGAVALVKPGVVGRIVSCKAKAAWCRVRAGGYGGWLKRASLWGIFPDETVSD